ncbi:hypothetical protein ACVWYH_006008 [Bradyrhizobium sp. GM24.11]
MFTLIMTARINDVDPKVRRIVEITQSHLHELLPWEWKAKPKM